MNNASIWAVVLACGECLGLATEAASVQVIRGNAINDARAAALSRDGRWWVTGRFTGDLSAGPGKDVSTQIAGFGTDVFLGEWSSDGSPKFLQMLGDSVTFGMGLRLAPAHDGGVFWVGEVQGDAAFGPIPLSGNGGFVARRDVSGAFLWARRFEQTVNGVIAAGAESLFVSGQRSRIIIEDGFAYVGMGAVVSRLAVSDGGLLWTVAASGTGQSYGRHVIRDSEGHLLVMGSYSGTITFGSQSVTSTGDFDFYVAKFNAEGQLLWLRGWGSSADDAALAIVPGREGRFYVTGYFGAPFKLGGTVLESRGGADAWVAAFGPNGDPLWAKSFGSVGEDAGEGLRLVSVEQLQVAATVNEGTLVNDVPLVGMGSKDILLLAMGVDGRLGEAQVLGSAGADEVHTLAGDPATGGILAASFDGPAAIEGRQFDDLTHSDVVLVRWPGEPSAGDPVRLEDVRWDKATGSLAFNLTGGVGRYRLELSADLRSWQGIQGFTLIGLPEEFRYTPKSIVDIAFFRLVPIAE